MRRYHDMSRQLNSAQAMCSEASAKPNAGIQAGLRRTDMISHTQTLKPNQCMPHSWLENLSF